MKSDRVKVVKEHPMVNELFPLGFETTYKKAYSVTEQTHKGWVNTIHYVEYENTDKKDKRSGNKIMEAIKKTREEIVPDKIIPKGTFLDAIFIAIDGTEYCGHWFYQMTGRPFAEFFEKI